MLERSVYSEAEFKKQSRFFVFCKINVDQQRHLAQQWGASALPTIKFLTKDLKEVHGFVGARPTSAFIAEMDKARAAAR